MKLPAFQFYPGDWLRDSISGCSLTAQGLWLRLMLLMHDSERYGYLCNNGSPIPFAQLARRCGCTLAEFEECFAELESAGVPERTKDGIIYSRRMSRDAEERLRNAERQRKHYEAKKQKPNASSNRQPNSNLTPTSQKPNNPSSSSSSSSSSKSERAHACAEEDVGWMDSEAVQIYRKAFLPEQPLPISVQEKIINTVTDLTTWAVAIDYWKTNRYRPESVGKMLDKYRELERDKLKAKPGEKRATTVTAEQREQFQQVKARIANTNLKAVGQ